nr:hypothetical protein CFP56_69550 [Quercus suber]
MFRQAIARQARLFSTSPIVRKSAVDSAKETVQAADKTVAQQIVKGIESAEQAAGKAKEAAGLSADHPPPEEKLLGSVCYHKKISSVPASCSVIIWESGINTYLSVLSKQCNRAFGYTIPQHGQFWQQCEAGVKLQTSTLVLYTWVLKYWDTIRRAVTVLALHTNCECLAKVDDFGRHNSLCGEVLTLPGTDLCCLSAIFDDRAWSINISRSSLLEACYALEHASAGRLVVEVIMHKALLLPTLQTIDMTNFPFLPPQADCRRDLHDELIGDLVQQNKSWLLLRQADGHSSMSINAGLKYPSPEVVIATYCTVPPPDSPAAARTAEL